MKQFRQYTLIADSVLLEQASDEWKSLALKAGSWKQGVAKDILVSPLRQCMLERLGEKRAKKGLCSKDESKEL